MVVLFTTHVVKSSYPVIDSLVLRRQQRICPHHPVATPAIATLGNHQFQLLNTGDIDLHLLRFAFAADPSRVEKHLSVTMHLERDRSLIALSLCL